MALEYVASVGPGGKVFGMDESIRLKGGEKFITFKASEAERVLGRELKFDADNKPILSEEELSILQAVNLKMGGSSSRNQRRLLKKMRRAIDERKKPIEKELQETRAKLNFLHHKSEAVDELHLWAVGGLKMEKPTGTMMHKLREAVQAGEAFIFASDHASPELFDDAFGDASIFVIEHDWAQAFTGATDFSDGEFQLPDEICAFEFRISGKHVIAVTFESDGTLWMQPIIQLSGGWLIPIYTYHWENGKWWPNIPHAREAKAENDWLIKLVPLIGAEIRAVAIALDADVAKTDLIRQPHRLNHAREKRGKLPLYDYHVVSLARRARAEPLPRDPDAEPGTRKRLHFVRGHWRHYQNSKTWIKWHLRGDPDLGFIDKHYKL